MDSNYWPWWNQHWIHLDSNPGPSFHGILEHKLYKFETKITIQSDLIPCLVRSGGFVLYNSKAQIMADAAHKSRLISEFLKMCFWNKNNNSWCGEVIFRSNLWKSSQMLIYCSVYLKVYLKGTSLSLRHYTTLHLTICQNKTKN